MIEKIIKKFIPNIFLKYRDKNNIKKIRAKFSKMEKNQIFKEIYLQKLWSPESIKSDYKFYSGIGSYLPELVDSYISEVGKFLLSLPKKPNVVDLGCGDFVIGSKLRQFCNNYIAVDIFDELINYNQEKYKDLNVDFRVLDITYDQLPPGDVCFVRQVLQHLSNESILNFLKIIENKYKYLVVTEHFPSSKNFVANLDKPNGPDVRLYDQSAVILTEPPFNLKVIKDINICETYSDSIEGMIKTKLLQLSI
tara:strand:+ start:3575 stop:4327 length:753 start_codon:yes stop_codon:yes gene_type:complete